MKDSLNTWSHRMSFIIGMFVCFTALQQIGCVQAKTPFETAIPIKTGDLPAEMPIKGVKMKLGLGACPSTGPRETTTAATDPSCSFVGLEAGTYCVSITADGATTAVYELGSTSGRIPAGYFQDANDNPSSYVTGTVRFDRAETKTINYRSVGPYQDPDDITVNFRPNDGEWQNT